MCNLPKRVFQKKRCHFEPAAQGLCYGAGEKTYTPGTIDPLCMAYKFSPHPDAQPGPLFVQNDIRLLEN